jgi:hypothetical protein
MYDQTDQQTVRGNGDRVNGDDPTEQRPSDVDPATGEPDTARDRDETMPHDAVDAERDEHTLDPERAAGDRGVPDENLTERPEPAMATGTPEMSPGDRAAAPPTGVWTGETAGAFRDKWREIQLRFVDEPRTAAGEARELVTEVTDALSAAVAARKSELDGWASTEGGDTEELRMAVRRYRDFLDRVLGL